MNRSFKIIAAAALLISSQAIAGSAAITGNANISANVGFTDSALSVASQGAVNVIPNLPPLITRTDIIAGGQLDAHCPGQNCHVIGGGTTVKGSITAISTVNTIQLCPGPDCRVINNQHTHPTDPDNTHDNDGTVPCRDADCGGNGVIVVHGDNPTDPINPNGNINNIPVVDQNVIERNFTPLNAPLISISDAWVNQNAVNFNQVVTINNLSTTSNVVTPITDANLGNLAPAAGGDNNGSADPSVNCANAQLANPLAQKSGGCNASAGSI